MLILNIGLENTFAVKSQMSFSFYEKIIKEMGKWDKIKHG